MPLLMSDEVSKSVCDNFLWEYIESLECLEIVLALAARRESATVAQLCAGLSMTPSQVSEVLARLVEAGVVVALPHGSQWHINPSPIIADGVAAVESAYRSNPFAIIATLASHSIERARTTTLKAFARAFELRKKGDG